MSTLSTSQIEKLKRAAKALARTASIPHADALDRLAKENGFQNWSLLAKHGNRSTAPTVAATSLASVAVVVEAKLPKSQRYYLHGDEVEDDPTKFYCAQCDLFVAADHFFSQHAPAETLERCLNSILRWERRPRSETEHRRRFGAANMLEHPARATVAPREAARGPFHRWLEQQKSKNTVVGDFASDVMRDKTFPVGATTYAEVHGYLDRFAPNAVAALQEAWKRYQLSGQRRT